MSMMNKPPYSIRSVEYTQMSSIIQDPTLVEPFPFQNNWKGSDGTGKSVRLNNGESGHPTKIFTSEI